MAIIDEDERGVIQRRLEIGRSMPGTGCDASISAASFTSKPDFGTAPCIDVPGIPRHLHRDVRTNPFGNEQVGVRNESGF